MIDWNWLWVIGQVGATYGFYRWWKANDAFLAVLEVAPDIDMDDLKNFSSLTTTIDYAAVHGFVQSNDSKSYSVLKSQFVPDYNGVIHRLIVRERKIEKFSTLWAETKRVIIDSTRHVPFRLVSSKGNFIRIDKPLEFKTIQDQLEVTHVQVEPNVNSNVDTLVGIFLGRVSKGIETKEKMLLIHAPLTGLGRLEKRSGVWYLTPHGKWGGILTRSSRHDILSDCRNRLNFSRFLAISFGIAAALTAGYLIYRYYLKRQERIPRLPPPPRTILPANDLNQNNDQNHRLQCVICSDNEVLYSLQPCSHLGLCYTCAEQLQSGSPEREICPICRTPIQQYQRVFLP
ncbi:unnamed protein product [Rotaria magnacalcarata]|uniref:RING-type E3 ubiquitin transferase n=1 Tax=Rotaria magnacalcarata TaxID=392030 RepID=A0A816P481_9BILA|nr:unnamed protein product [Rotaria magnacalcarata]CAF1558879.1 unnamed protein product [Rotaria magnacalcarata]CAF2043874.1 unnamed protein product [Rotaria magnacalcarata]CAF3869746.1 unnamed protein product [Rotaria magnacalcarata]CAF3874972.1 unnamed protein product [Rotaria magnacalcarata]